MIATDKNIKLKRLAEQTGFEISLRFNKYAGSLVWAQWRTSFLPNLTLHSVLLLQNMNHQVFSAIQSTDLWAEMKFRVLRFVSLGCPLFFCSVISVSLYPQVTSTSTPQPQGLSIRLVCQPTCNQAKKNQTKWKNQTVIWSIMFTSLTSET